MVHVSRPDLFFVSQGYEVRQTERYGPWLYIKQTFPIPKLETRDNQFIILQSHYYGKYVLF